MSAKELAAACKAQGNAALSAGKFDEAIEHYTEAIGHDSSDHVFFSNRSAAYLSKGDAAKALEDAEQVVSMKPDWAKGYGRKGAALHSLGKHDEAIAAYQDGLKVDPENAALKSGLSDTEAAMKAAASPAGGMPGNPFGPDMWAKLATNPKTAAYLQDPAFVEQLKKLQQNPSDLNSAMQDPRLIEAFGVILGIPMSAPEPFAPSPSPAPAPAPAPAPEPPKEETPEEKEFREKKEAADKVKAAGTAHYRKKEFEAALKAYQEAESMNPDPADISYKLNQAAVYFEMNDLDTSIKVCEDALTHARENGTPFPLRAKALARIGNARVKQGDFAAAIEAYEQSLVESHSDDVFKRLKKTKIQKKTADELAYQDPELAEAEKAKGNDLFKTGDFPGAIAAYSEAIRRNPKSAVYYANRAAARTKLMDFANAMSDCTEALKLDPTYVKAYSRKGALQFLTKEYHKAMETYQEGLKIDPENAECQEGLRSTIQKINALSSGGGEMDAERAQRGMQDPEVQSILRDPMVQATLQRMQEDKTGAEMRKALNDPTMSAKLSKLVAAGVLQVK